MRFPTSPQTSHTTPPCPHSPLLVSPHTWLRTQKQSDRNMFISQLLGLSASIFVFSVFCPVAMGEVSPLWPRADKPSTCAWDSEPCLLRDIMVMTMTSLSPAPPGSPSVPHQPHLHTFPSVSWPHIPPLLLLPSILPALIHGMDTWVVYGHPASHFAFPTCSSRVLHNLFSLDPYVAKSNA